MNTPLRSARQLASRVAAYVVALCLLSAPSASMDAHAKLRQRPKKAAPDSVVITKKEADKVLIPGRGITLTAAVFSRSGERIEGGEVKWKATPSDNVLIGQFVDTGTLHQATLVGLDPRDENAEPVTIEVTATAANGKVSEPVTVVYRPNIKVSIAPVADQTQDKAEAGTKYGLEATVRDKVGAVPGATVRWTLADPAQEQYLLLAHSQQNPNKVYAVRLQAPDPATAPSSIIVVANYEGIKNYASVPFKGGGAVTPGGAGERVKVEELVVKKVGMPCSDQDFQVEPGRRLTLQATNPDAVDICKDDSKDADGDVADAADNAPAKKTPQITWEVPRKMRPFVGMLPQTKAQEREGVAVFYGLIPEPETAGGVAPEPPDSLYVIAKLGDFAKAVPIRNGEQTVDVSWSILPKDVVAKNYGRGVSEMFYGIEVVIGNNSGNDLQLTGLSFEIDRSLLINHTNTTLLPRMPVSSYEVVRGMTEQRKFSFKSRSTILGALDTAAQIMTGFTPYFNVATRARNYSQAINILGNPVTKGIERVWPDPQQDELGRLERQALHDDKIIPDNTVYRTTVFFPREILPKPTAGASGDQPEGKQANTSGNQPAAKQANTSGNQLVAKQADASGVQAAAKQTGKEDLMAVRKQLGQLILVGSKLNRNDFQMRVRQGFRQASGGNGQ